jgi:hypothetical protein
VTTYYKFAQARHSIYVRSTSSNRERCGNRGCRRWRVRSICEQGSGSVMQRESGP